MTKWQLFRELSRMADLPKDARSARVTALRTLGEEIVSLAEREGRSLELEELVLMIYRGVTQAASSGGDRSVNEIPAGPAVAFLNNPDVRAIVDEFSRNRQAFAGGRWVCITSTPSSSVCITVSPMASLEWPRGTVKSPS